MKDSYVGDIGDFANNGLLRHFFGGPGAPAVDNPLKLKLGVVSYLNDWALIDYLNDDTTQGAALRECDPYLYNTLQGFVYERIRNRKISTVEYRGILLDGTPFYNCPLPRGTRDAWVVGALNKIAEANVIFVNPDNGIATPTMEENSKIAPEYVSLTELKCLFDKGKSLVIYQHQNRTERQAKAIAERLQNKLCLPHLPWVLRWRPVSVRYYFIVPQPCHEAFFNERIEALKGTEWYREGHFTVVTIDDG